MFTVHPRLRGELFFYDLLPPDYCGSSPLRGELSCQSIDPIRLSRFIPAYAGNSSSALTHTALGSVHPRLRGELKAWGAYEDGLNGSSPLTRGTPND